MAVYDKKSVAVPQGSKANAKSLAGSSVTNINKKARSWTWVVYQDQYINVLAWLERNPDIAWSMSPKHEKDVNPTGEPKKPHWHLLLNWSGPITYKTACDISEELGLPRPQICRNTRGMVRYFLHLDNPEKAQYDRSLITCGGGFEVDDYLALSKTEQEQEEVLFVTKIINKITELDLQEFYELANFVLSEMPEHYQYFKKNSYVLKNYLTSKLFHHESQNEHKKKT